MKAWDRVSGWLRQRTLLRDVLIGIALGAFIEFVALPLYFHNLAIVRRTGDETVDRMIRLAQRTTGVVHNATPFVFIDIDDATWAAWGHKLITPRDRIAALIDHAAASKPALILVDIDLSWPSGDQAGDDALKKFVEGYGDAQPPLLLIRPLKNPPRDNSTQLPKRRRTVVENDQTDLGRSVKWVSSQFERDGDGVVGAGASTRRSAIPAGVPPRCPRCS
jgi:CHASE2 domain-containing sensor protein